MSQGWDSPGEGRDTDGRIVGAEQYSYTGQWILTWVKQAAETRDQ